MDYQFPAGFWWGQPLVAHKQKVYLKVMAKGKHLGLLVSARTREIFQWGRS